MIPICFANLVSKNVITIKPIVPCCIKVYTSLYKSIFLGNYATQKFIIHKNQNFDISHNPSSYPSPFAPTTDTL